MATSNHNQAQIKSDPDHPIGGMSVARAVVYILLGFAGLVLGGDFIVEGATGIARSFGLSERVIGLAIVGPGTSVLELVAPSSRR